MIKSNWCARCTLLSIVVVVGRVVVMVVADVCVCVSVLANYPKKTPNSIVNRKNSAPTLFESSPLDFRMISGIICKLK